MEDRLTELKTWVEDFIDNTRDSRLLSERDRDYIDHKQWTDDEIATLQKRKQPVTTENIVRKKIDFLLGLERQTRTDPKAFPRTPQHDSDAEAVTDALRFICDNNDFSTKRSSVAESIFIEGTGGVEVTYNPETKEVENKRIQWDRLIYDHHSRELDFSDAKWLGYYVWLDVDDAKRLYPDSAELLIETINNSRDTEDDTYDDAPRISWVDRKRERVRVAQLWYREGRDWMECHFTEGGFLIEPEVSFYKTEFDRSACPLELQSAFCDRDGNRYGVVRGMISLQDEVNKRRSKSLHLLSVNQSWGVKGAVKNVPQLKAEKAKPDGHIEFENIGQMNQDFGFLPTGDMAMAQFQLLNDARNALGDQGANPSLMGTEGQGSSGRAIMAKQQGGQVEIASIMDSIRQWQKRVYRADWDRVKQFWTEEKWVRVTDGEDGVKFVGLNKPITVADKLKEEMGGIPPQLQNDPRLNMVVEIKNHVAEIDVDIILEESPDTVNIQGEQFQQIAQILPGMPQDLQRDGFIGLLQSSTLRNKKEWIDKLKGNDEKSAQQQQMMMQKQQQQEQIQQQALQLEMADKHADVQKKQSEAAKNAAMIDKTRAETQQTKVDTAHKYHLG